MYSKAALLFFTFLFSPLFTHLSFADTDLDAEVRKKLDIKSEQELFEFIDGLKVFANSTGGRGSGHGVQLKDGSIRFLDLLEEEDLNSVVAFDEGKVFSKENCTLETTAPFQASSEVRQQLNELLEGIEETPEAQMFASFFKMQVDYLLNKSIAIQFNPKNYLKDWQYSARSIPSEHLLPLGFFTGANLIISTPVYNKLSLDDQVGFLVHEVLRQFSVYAARDLPVYETGVIEQATYLLIQRKYKEFAYLLHLEKVTAFWETLIESMELVKKISMSTLLYLGSQSKVGGIQLTDGASYQSTYKAIKQKPDFNDFFKKLPTPREYKRQRRKSKRRLLKIIAKKYIQFERLRQKTVQIALSFPNKLNKEKSKQMDGSSLLMSSLYSLNRLEVVVTSEYLLKTLFALLFKGKIWNQAKKYIPKEDQAWLRKNPAYNQGNQKITLLNSNIYQKFSSIYLNQELNFKGDFPTEGKVCYRYLGKAIKRFGLSSHPKTRKQGIDLRTLFQTCRDISKWLVQKNKKPTLKRISRTIKKHINIKGTLKGSRLIDIDESGFIEFFHHNYADFMRYGAKELSENKRATMQFALETKIKIFTERLFGSFSSYLCPYVTDHLKKGHSSLKGNTSH